MISPKAGGEDRALVSAVLIRAMSGSAVSGTVVGPSVSKSVLETSVTSLSSGALPVTVAVFSICSLLTSSWLNS